MPSFPLEIIFPLLVKRPIAPLLTMACPPFELVLPNTVPIEALDMVDIEPSFTIPAKSPEITPKLDISVISLDPALYIPTFTPLIEPLLVSEPIEALFWIPNVPPSIIPPLFSRFPIVPSL